MSVVTLSADLQGSGNTVPDWIQLLPDSAEFAAVDGREFVIKDAAEIIGLSMRKNVDINIDYEHSIKDKSKDIKPAAGWIKELAIRENAIWGRVEWTPKATQMITNKEYRYLSPLLSTIPTIDGKHMISKIVNVALTNYPALEMSAFCSNKEVSGLHEIHDLSAMSQIAELMNMESCSPTDILQALQQQKGEQELQACTADVESAISTYVFPRACEDDLLTMRQTLGQERFQALTQKLSFSGVGFAYLNGKNQTQALTARGINFEDPNNLFGLSASELAVCKETDVKPEDYIKIKEANNVN